MTKIYSIKEFCCLTTVSVRTLHYYDEINLLKPSRRTNKGHRFYTGQDLLRMQQIMTLKFMGMSLLQIKKILQAENMNICELFKMQSQALTEEMKRLKKIDHFLKYLIHQNELQHDIDWQSVVKIMEVFKQKKLTTQNWYEKYLSQLEFQQFKKFEKKRTKEWQNLFRDIQKNLHNDPEGKTALKLLKEGMSLAHSAYGDQPELMYKLWEAYKAGILPQNSFPQDKKVIAFLSKALKKLKS